MNGRNGYHNQKPVPVVNNGLNHCVKEKEKMKSIDKIDLKKAMNDSRSIIKNMKMIYWV